MTQTWSLTVSSQLVDSHPGEDFLCINAGKQELRPQGFIEISRSLKNSKGYSISCLTDIDNTE
jgi:hypothetical protein